MIANQQIQCGPKTPFSQKLRSENDGWSKIVVIFPDFV
jgi:hypothetical protein